MDRIQLFQLLDTMDEGNWKERKVELMRLLR
jgi:hypothetical protein